MADDLTYEFDAELWLWQARSTSWTFVSLPTDVADEVLDVAEPFSRGFGSLRVQVTVGTTTWRTSVFPSAETYVLPVKKAVRTAEGLEAGSTARVRLTLLDVPTPGGAPGTGPTAPVLAPPPDAHRAGTTASSRRRGAGGGSGGGGAGGDGGTRT